MTSSKNLVLNHSVRRRTSIRVARSAGRSRRPFRAGPRVSSRYSAMIAAPGTAISSSHRTGVVPDGLSCRKLSWRSPGPLLGGLGLDAHLGEREADEAGMRAESVVVENGHRVPENSG